MDESLDVRQVLLVEDNPADAELVEVMLDSITGPVRYRVRHVDSLEAATALLEATPFDIVLLDLRLPDADGVDAVRKVLKIIGDLPVVVLTGLEDESLAVACIDAGAQDYLSKGELAPLPLIRAIGHSIHRARETQIREMNATIAQYRALSTAGATTSVTAALAGVGPARDRAPEAFGELGKTYEKLLYGYVDQLAYKKEKPRDLMERMVTAVGDLGGGPRDLLDLHLASLEAVVANSTREKARAFVIEGRLLALELMGLLVDYYRTGRRRRTFGGERQ